MQNRGGGVQGTCNPCQLIARNKGEHQSSGSIQFIKSKNPNKLKFLLEQILPNYEERKPNQMT